jgi:type 1 glutamine amidotransferase
MRTLTAIILSLCALPAFADEPKIKVLIVDGQNNHNWRATTPVMKKWLESCGRFTVEVATAPTAPGMPQKPKPDAGDEAKQKYEAALARYKDERELYQTQMAAFRPPFGQFDVVVSNYNGESWPAETNAALEDALKSGKIGLVIVHAANNSFDGWKEYNRMIGMGWRDNKFGDRLIVTDSGEEKRVPKGQGPGAGHGPMHPFKIVIRDKEHPVVKGMPAEWLHNNDELYQGMRGPVENVHLIATTLAEKKFNGSGEHEPMIWTVQYGAGRVFHTPMGHDVGAMKCVGFVATLQRGTEWAATGKVTIPLPENFPTADKTSVVK